MNPIDFTAIWQGVQPHIVLLLVLILANLRKQRRDYINLHNRVCALETKHKMPASPPPESADIVDDLSALLPLTPATAKPTR